MISTFQLWQLAVWVWVWDNPELGEDHDFSLPHWEGQLSQSHCPGLDLAVICFTFFVIQLKGPGAWQMLQAETVKKPYFVIGGTVAVSARTPDGDVKPGLRTPCRGEWKHKDLTPPLVQSSTADRSHFPRRSLILQTVSCRYNDIHWHIHLHQHNQHQVQHWNLIYRSQRLGPHTEIIAGGSD